MRGIKVKGISSVTSKIANVLRRKPKAKVRAQSIYGGGPGGHRGIAAGNLEPGKQDFSPENIAKWEMLSGQEAEAFLYQGAPLTVHSTNVESVSYDIDKNEMTVAFLGGGVYRYSGVTEQEAQQFLQAQSKGGFVWSVLRVRGSKTQHRKPYIRLS